MMFVAKNDEETSPQILDTFVEAGGDLVDTADVHRQGRFEDRLITR